MEEEKFEINIMIKSVIICILMIISGIIGAALADIGEKPFAITLGIIILALTCMLGALAFSKITPKKSEEKQKQKKMNVRRSSYLLLLIMIATNNAFAADADTSVGLLEIVAYTYCALAFAVIILTGIGPYFIKRSYEGETGRQKRKCYHTQG